MNPETRQRHAELKALFGLGTKDQGDVQAPKAKSLWPLGVALLVVVALGAGFYGALQLLRERESAIAAEEHQREIDEELQRRNAVQFAQLGFLDSFPPLVAISDAEGPLYAKDADGVYTPLRARAGTWINNLAIKEDTVLRYYFSAEGFKTLEKSIAYADWYPKQDPEISLQRTYRKVVLEPIQSPLLPYCEELKTYEQYKNACDFHVFTEIVGRAGYSQKVGLEAEKKDTLAKPKQAEGELFTSPYPEVLTGSIAIRSDVADTKVFFMGEPLMIVKENGNMVQARVSPGEAFQFSTYGQNRLIDITQPLSLRLEAPNFPPFMTEILSHEWHCKPKKMQDFLLISSPPFVMDGSEPRLLQYACDYEVSVEVQFKRFLGARP